MNNVYSLKEFKKINEESLVGKAFKNLMKKVFSKIDQRLASTVSDFTKKIENKNDIKEVVPYVNTFIETTNGYLEDELKKTTDLITVRKAVADTALSIFDTMQLLSNQFKNDELKAKNLLSDSKYKQIFDYDNVKRFNKNLTKNVNNFLFNVAQVSGMDSEYVKNLFDKPIYEHYEKDSGLGIQGSKPVDKAPEDQDISKVDNPLLEEKPKKISDKSIKKLKGVDEKLILEEDQTEQNDQSTQPENVNQDQDTQNQEDNQNVQDQSDQSDQSEEKVSEEQLNKFKQTITTIFKDNILGPIFKKFKTPDKFTKGEGNTSKEVQDVAKTMGGSDNLDSKKNLLNTIATKADSPKKLAGVRDAVSKELGIKNPQKEIGKF